MKNIEIGEYTNYRHNAYDGYQCSWGVIMGLGGSGNAFTEDDKICGDTHWDEETCEYSCDCPTEMGQAIEDFDNNLDVEIMLQNLDTTIDVIQDGLNDDGEYTHNEYAGDSMPITFKRMDNNVICSLDISEKHYDFIVTNLI